MVARGRVVGPDLVRDEVLAVVEGREGDGRHEHRQHLCCDDRQAGRGTGRQGSGGAGGRGADRQEEEAEETGAW